MIRSLYPTDLLSYILSAQPLPPNQARAGPGNRSLFSPEVFMEHWLPLAGRRHSWVWPQGGGLGGLVSARSLTAPTAWQVDYLQAEDGELCTALLEAVANAATRHGVRKLFLKMPMDSALAEAVRLAGFSSYSRAAIYRYGGEPVQATALPEPYNLRPGSHDDYYGLFELYSACVPQPVRTAEGLTLDEWHASRERGRWLEQRGEFLLNRQDTLSGWLRVTTARGSGCLEIMCRQVEDDVLAGLVRYGLACLHGRHPVRCVVPAYQAQLAAAVESAGFEKVRECDDCVKQVAIKVKDPQFIPMRA